AYTPAPIARHQRSSTQLTSLLINNAGALGPEGVAGLSSLSCALRSGLSAGSGCCARWGLYLMVLCRNAS
ncbi:hypothetical protein, partial [Mycobacterium pseudoshottsii]|uniref:hypothetical protein n=1 Tax=Mycobacterium pseudoshottsii TaxID=265949 RepID=UPI001F1741AD